MVTFPSGAKKQATWRAKTPIVDTLAAAKHAAASILQALLDAHLTDDAERTNWPSLTAAVQRHMQDFNRRLVSH